MGVRAVPGGSESSGWCSGGEGSLEEPDDAFAAVLDALAAENQHLKRQLADACERVAKTTKVTHPHITGIPSDVYLLTRRSNCQREY